MRGRKGGGHREEYGILKHYQSWTRLGWCYYSLASCKWWKKTVFRFFKYIQVYLRAGGVQGETRGHTTSVNELLNFTSLNSNTEVNEYFFIC